MIENQPPDIWSLFLFVAVLLMTDDVEGRPVMVTVTHREWKGKQGDTMTAVEVSDTKLWESGKPKKTTMSEEDIPF